MLPWLVSASVGTVECNEADVKQTILLLLATLALSIGAAQATQQGNGAIAKWKTMDKCARQAQTAFPDFSPDSNAKRDAALKNCLNANNLPPRDPLAAPQSH
jgi:hypothetical protein